MRAPSRQSTRVALLGTIAACAIVAGGATASPSVAYCSIPAGPANPSWAFHAGAPIQAASGTYIHGHGTVSGSTAHGQICQVIRTAGASDRQIILAPTRSPVSIQPGITVGGVLGNQLSLQVRVSSSTDRRCKTGTKGSLTLFASYNSPSRHDTIKLAFTSSCRRDSHSYSGPAVIVLVPR